MSIIHLGIKEEYSGDSLKVNLGWAIAVLGSGLGIALGKQFFTIDTTGQMMAMIIALLVVGVGYGRLVLRDIARPLWQFLGIISFTALTVGFVMALAQSF